ncbi:uncharacterized protein LOC127532551 isoform X2 [Acanthochromis polyacanthus]|uniref:uncharacterized protein LOC127532551 isoform X2 n=2 Tax=Acanthochromis polyacanthus TaxID=80966 RepID=UPI002234644D|nr:uncharacterized protein LOC127532551 isoform X2 [Acanthochromis polyacanthus]XP_051800341.1 uncharacterized protein LOC127532551 isoform X2 [Acanthochromis polyacanthus]
MQNMEPDTEETDHMLEDLGTEEDLEDEGFEDANVDPTVGLLDITDPSSQPSTAIATSACSAGTPTSVQPPTSEATSSAPYLPAPTDLPAAVPTTVPTPAQPLQQLAKDLSSVTSFGTSAATTSSASAPPLPTTVSAAISTATDAPAGPSRPPAMSPAQYHQQVGTFFATGASVSTSSSASAPPLPTTVTTSVSTAPADAPCGPPAMCPAAPEREAVDERGIPGMDRVDGLAECLVGSRAENGQTLTNQQASTIIALWQNLLPYDQQRVAYAAQHQVRLTTGRYKQPKRKAEFTPGAESMTGCVLGSSGSPTQWPDCCRLVEAVFIKLCNNHKSPQKKDNYALTRWTLILRDYNKIRQLVLGNGTVMQSTTLQLFAVNQTTLVQWHNKRLKRQDCRILLQGVNLPATISVAPMPLPPPQVRPTAAPTRPGPQHEYNLPESTAGQAVLKRKSTAFPPLDAPPIVRPRLPAQRQLFPRQAPPPMVFIPTPSTSPLIFQAPQVFAPAPKAVAPAGPLPPPTPTRRPYSRTVEKNKCGQCHQPRTKESGYSQYYGHIYCPLNAGLPLDQWMEEMRRKRANQ